MWKLRLAAYISLDKPYFLVYLIYNTASAAEQVTYRRRLSFILLVQCENSNDENPNWFSKIHNLGHCLRQHKASF
jgi:hypothetical protein